MCLLCGCELFSCCVLLCLLWCSAVWCRGYRCICCYCQRVFVSCVVDLCGVVYNGAVGGLGVVLFACIVRHVALDVVLWVV